MKNRKLKIAIDILLTIFFVLSYGISVGMATSTHMVIGIIAGMLSIAHLMINRQRFLAVFKKGAAKKLNTKSKWQYGMSLFLTITWSVCVVTGVLIGFPIILYSFGVTDLFMFTVIHILSAFLSLVLIIVHIAQHARHIKSYFKKRNTVVKEVRSTV